MNLSKSPMKSNADPARFRKRYATLVEVVLAMLLIAILAIGGGAYITHARSGVSVQRARRAALEAAQTRLEEVLAAPFDDVAPPQSSATYHLSKHNDRWRVTSADPQEIVQVNGVDRPITTTVQFLDADAGSTSQDYLQLKVSIEYWTGSDENVTLETRKTQW